MKTKSSSNKNLCHFVGVERVAQPEVGKTESSFKSNNNTLRCSQKTKCQALLEVSSWGHTCASYARMLESANIAQLEKGDISVKHTHTHTHTHASHTHSLIWFKWEHKFSKGGNWIPVTVVIVVVVFVVIVIIIVCGNNALGGTDMNPRTAKFISYQ